MAVSEAAHPLADPHPLAASALAVSEAAHPLPDLHPLAASALAVSEAALPLADLAISEASVDLAGLATLPLLAPLRLRRLASGLAQHLFLPLGSVLPASLRLRS